MALFDPRSLVEQPVRRELAAVILRGLALVAVPAVLAALPVIWPLDASTRNLVVAVAVLLLLGYALLVHAVRLVRGRTSVAAREEAWARAKEVDAADAWLGRLISGWVPIGLLMALGVLVWPHVTDPNPALGCAWVVLGLPPIAVAWLFASSTWLDACREDLARAEGESDARFRRYWANPGR